MKKQGLFFPVSVIALIILGFLSMAAGSQTCPVVLEHRGDQPITLKIWVTGTILFYNNPKFFLEDKATCGEIGLVRKDTTLPVPLSHRQNGSVLRFWPQKSLQGGEYILIVGKEKYPLSIVSNH